VAIDASIALSAGQATSPTGQSTQVPNYLANPQALNALLQMSGQMAAGRALQQSIGPDGNIDFQSFASTLANNPNAAPYAFEAMNKGLDAAGKQLQQQITRRQQGASLIAPLLLDPEFTQKNPEYAQKQLHDALTRGVAQGTLDNKTAIYFGSNLPTMLDGDGKRSMDVNATRKELTRAFVSILPPTELQNAITGKPFIADYGGSTQPLIMNQTLGTITPIGPISPKSETQASQAEPIAGEPTPSGAPTQKPRSSNMPYGGATPGISTTPNTTGAPRVPGQQQTSQTPTPQQPRSNFNVATQVDDMMRKPVDERTKWWNGLNAQQKQQVRAELARRAK